MAALYLDAQQSNGIEDLHFDVDVGSEVVPRERGQGTRRVLQAGKETLVVAEESVSTRHRADLVVGCEVIEKSKDGQASVTFRAERAGRGALGVTRDSNERRVSFVSE